MKIIDGHDVIEHAEVNGESRDFIRKLTDYIEDADAVEPKWIPCSEKLPSDGELCLVSVIMDDAPYEIIISDSVTYCYERGWVNAWMPLPRPWKGADDE